jgi:alkylation response protein AidB-like acyl-CoA dehydrogenase
VDLELSDDQELFRETTARFIETKCPLPRVRELIDDPTGHERTVVHDAGDLGWYALFVPEEFGGGSVSGAPVMDAVIVAEERGRFLQPGPFVATNVVAAALARDGGAKLQAEFLSRLASGETTATWVIGDRGGAPEAGAVIAAARDGGYALDGVGGLVPDAGTADLLLVSARDRERVTQFLVPATAPGVVVEPLMGLDLTRRFAEVRFDRVAVGESAVVGEPGAGAAAVGRQLDVALALVTAESVGAMTALLELTVQYAKDRIAFGRPIGSFQAVKHLLADSSLSVELAKTAAVAAARAVAEERPSASEIASIAKAFVGDAGVEVGQACFQVHGGIGFTWEHDLHLYLRRLTADRAWFGDPEWHRERICTRHGL